MKPYYIKAGSYPLFKVEARNPEEAKKAFREKYGLKKMPMGSIVASNKDSDFLK